MFLCCEWRSLITRQHEPMPLMTELTNKYRRMSRRQLVSQSDRQADRQADILKEILLERLRGETHFLKRVDGLWKKRKWRPRRWPEGLKGSLTISGPHGGRSLMSCRSGEYKPGQAPAVCARHWREATQHVTGVDRFRGRHQPDIISRVCHMAAARLT